MKFPGIFRQDGKHWRYIGEPNGIDNTCDVVSFAWADKRSTRNGKLELVVDVIRSEESTHASLPEWAIENLQEWIAKGGIEDDEEATQINTQCV